MSKRVGRRRLVVEAIVVEALRRGAQVDRVVELIAGRRVSRSAAATRPSAASSDARAADALNWLSGGGSSETRTRSLLRERSALDSTGFACS